MYESDVAFYFRHAVFFVEANENVPNGKAKYVSAKYTKRVKRTTIVIDIHAALQHQYGRSYVMLIVEAL